MHNKLADLPMGPTGNPPQGLGQTVAHGVDVVDIEDLRRLVETPLSSELDRIFTRGELEAAGGSELRLQKLAGRLATKEAVMKALGVGFGDGVSFLDVETVNLQSGAPDVVLHNRVADIAKQTGVTRWLVSTSHTDKVAFASVLGLSGA